MQGAEKHVVLQCEYTRSQIHNVGNFRGQMVELFQNMLNWKEIR